MNIQDIPILLVGLAILTIFYVIYKELFSGESVQDKDEKNGEHTR